MDLMASSEDVLLAVTRQVIDVFSHDDGGQESWGGDAAFLQSFGQGRNDRRLLAPLAADIFAADQTTQQKPRGFIIKLLTDLRADQAVLLRGSLHLVRLEDFLHHRQILRPTLASRAARLNGGSGRIGLLQRGGPGFSLRDPGQLEQKQLQLGGIELFAARAEQTPHQSVDLLLHQTQMLFEVGDAPITLGDLGQKLLAAQVLHACHSQHFACQDNVSTTPRFFLPLIPRP